MADRRLGYALALWALVLVTTDVAAQIQPNTWLFRDGRFYVNVNENLLERGSLEDPFAASWYDGDLAWNYNLSADFSNVALGARGEHYHFRPWLLPILSTPLYFALGLLGVLLFNLLTYSVIAAGTYRFARAWAPPDASALAAIVMVFASGFRHHAYNYSVDLLLVALFTAGLGLMVNKRGAVAGALIAAAVMIKPTTLLYAPALALILHERRDVPTLKRAIGGGSIVLALYGCMNTYMFGRPWWTGYNRAVITVNGEPGIFDDVHGFETPFTEGAIDLISGADGLIWWHGAFVIALPGLVLFLKRAPRAALGVIASFAGAFYVFSKFQYHTDRFMFPAIALLSVPVALGVLWLARALRDGALGSLAGRVRIGRAPLAAFVLSLVVLFGAVVTSPAPLSARTIDAGTTEGALLLAEGSLDVREATSDVTVRTSEIGSTVSLGAGDRWVPRAAPIALLVLAPFAALGGRTGVALASMLAAALAILACTQLLRRAIPAPLAAAVAVGALLVGPAREAAIGDPAGALAAMAFASALALAVHASRDAKRTWAAAGVLAVAGGSFADAPLAGLVILAGVVFVAWTAGKGAMQRTALGGAGALVVHGLFALVVFGGVDASPDDLVVISSDGALTSIPHTTALGALDDIAAAGPSTARAVVPFLFFLLPGIAFARGTKVRAALAALLGVLIVPNVAMADEHVTLLAVVALTMPAGVVAAALAERLTRVAAEFGSTRLLGAALAVVLVLSLAFGLTRRAAANERAFWIGTPASVRAAEVHVGDVPCDFLAWENMAWECSFYDGGALGRVGLALPDGPMIEGRVVRNMLLVPTAERSTEPRVVAFHGVPSGPRLLLVVGAPDGFDSDADVRVRIDGEEIALFTVPRSPRGLVEHVVNTSRFEGDVDLEIDMRAAGAARRAAILIAGGFVGPALDADVNTDAATGDEGELP